MRIAIIILISTLEMRNLMPKEAILLFNNLQERLVSVRIDWITYQ